MSSPATFRTASESDCHNTVADATIVGEEAWLMLSMHRSVLGRADSMNNASHASKGASGYQPITMFDSMTLRALSTSLPVSLMYSRMACNLSPDDLHKHSRAIEQTSTLCPVNPKAPLDITQVSRGLLVSLTTRSPGKFSSMTAFADDSSLHHVIMM